ncbi:Ion-translocating oxidoreductase complex subunit C [subsurface metagenome]
MEWQGINGGDLLKSLADKGIVGLGGATFPTVLKYTIRKGFQVEYFVVNGVECEPFLTADHRLMLEKSLEILEGIRIVQQIMKPRQIIIGIEENKPDAIAVMRENIVSAGLDFKVVALKMKYPQGDEKQLLKAVIGKEVPSGGLPLDIGAVVSNVGTMKAIYEAIVLDKPLIERVVTVSGSIIRKPANLKVRLGTPLSELIEECGGFIEPPAELIAGGPMMGFAVLDPDTPVTKGLSGVIALSRRQVRSHSQTPCIGCGRCVKACPLGLLPTVIYKWIEHGEYEEALQEGLMDCKECGCCGYSCPARIPLIQGMKLGKVMSRKIKKA